MDSIYFYIPLFVHLISIAVGFGAVVVIDSFGLLWLLKKVKLATVVNVATVTQRLIWLGWCGLVASGIPMILIKGYVDNLTVIKFMSVALLGLNGLLLHFVKKNLDNVSDDNVPNLVKFRIGFASTVSQLGWWSAIFIGFIHRHWRHNIDFPSNPWPFVITVPVVLVIVFIAGEKIFAHDKHDR